MPRIHPLATADAEPTQLELLEPLGGDEALHLFRTLAHNPALLKSWLRFGGQLLYRSTLPARERELVILRTAMLCGSDYEWGQHVRLAREAGLDDDEIRAVAQRPISEDWNDSDAGLLRAVDELVLDHDLSDETWAHLSSRYDDAQLVELTMLPGHYAMLAAALRSMRVRTEVPLPRIGDVDARGDEARGDEARGDEARGDE